MGDLSTNQFPYEENLWMYNSSFIITFYFEKQPHEKERNEYLCCLKQKIIALFVPDNCQ